VALLEGAMLGGAIGGPVGLVIGGLLGGALDLFNFFTQAGAQATATEASLLGQETAISGQLAQLAIQKATTEMQLKEAEDKAAAYQTFLAKIPTAGEALTAGTGDLEFDRQYRALLGNLGNLNVLAGATGNVGPGTSMALVQEQGKADVGSFVETTRDVSQRQLDIFTASAATLTTALGTIGQTEADLAASAAALEALKNKPNMITAMGNWWNDLWTPGL